MGIFKKQKYKVAKSAKLMGVRTAVESEFHLIGQIDVNYSVYCFSLSMLMVHQERKKLHPMRQMVQARKRQDFSS